MPTPAIPTPAFPTTRPEAIGFVSINTCSGQPRQIPNRLSVFRVFYRWHSVSFGIVHNDVGVVFSI